MGKTGNPIGRRGDWFADWDGLLLPCVHKYWWKHEGKKAWYHDPGYLPEDRLWIQLVKGLEENRRAILTDDEVKIEPGKQSGISFDRKGYIAVYEIGPIEIVDKRFFDFNS